MERWAGRVALVTGASSGIGATLAEKLVKCGMKVVGCARNDTAIEELSQKLKGEKGQLTAVKCDVTKEEDILAAFRKAKEVYGGVDVCVNNAGLSHAEPLLSGSTDQWRNMLEVNVLGVAICAREAFKSMQERNVDDGHIINVNSMSGHRIISSPASSMYSASKFAVTGMTEAFRNELREAKSNIRVSQVSPGLVATEFRQRMRKLPIEDSAEYFSQKPHLEADDVADAIIYLLSAPPHVQIHDVLMRPTQGIA